MKYFNSAIDSIDELKKVYRTLALANHPDRGGKTDVMQAINAEFDIMYSIVSMHEAKIKVTNSEKQNYESSRTYRHNFYTENGWQGSRYDKDLTTKQITALIREYVKNAWPQYKFSVTFECYSMGCTIHIALKSGPTEAFTKNSACKSGYKQVNHYCISTQADLTEPIKNVLINVKKFADSFNYSDCDAMIDYFDVCFHLSLNVGDYGKPYEIKVNKPARIKCKRSDVVAK